MTRCHPVSASLGIGLAFVFSLTACGFGPSAESAIAPTADEGAGAGLTSPDPEAPTTLAEPTTTGSESESQDSGDAGETSDTMTESTDTAVGPDDTTAESDLAPDDASGPAEPLVPCAEMPAAGATATSTPLGPSAAASNSEPAMSAFADSIRDRGVVHVAVRDTDIPYVDDFDRAIAVELVGRLFPDDSLGIHFRPQSRDSRYDVLASGEADMLLYNFAPFESRLDFEMIFSTAYFLEFPAITVGSSCPTDPIDSGGVIAAFCSTECRLELDLSDERFETFEQLGLAQQRYVNGELDAIAGTWPYIMPEGTVSSVGRRGDATPWSVAVAEGQDTFLAEIDERLAVMLADGTWTELYEASFGGEPPFAVDEMVTAEVPIPGI